MKHWTVFDHSTIWFRRCWISLFTLHPLDDWKQPLKCLACIHTRPYWQKCEQYSGQTKQIKVFWSGEIGDLISDIFFSRPSEQSRTFSVRKPFKSEGSVLCLFDIFVVECFVSRDVCRVIYMKWMIIIWRQIYFPIHSRFNEVPANVCNFLYTLLISGLLFTAFCLPKCLGSWNDAQQYNNTLWTKIPAKHAYNIIRTIKALE